MAIEVSDPLHNKELAAGLYLKMRGGPNGRVCRLCGVGGKYGREKKAVVDVNRRRHDTSS